jgi:hypothetical protein
LFQEQVFLHGEKENFEEYSLILEFAELSFPILNNYSAEMRQPCPRATVFEVFIAVIILLRQLVILVT